MTNNNNLLRSYNEEEGRAEARLRIAKVAASGSVELDLGGLSLTEIPTEIYSIPLLKRLFLGLHASVRTKTYLDLTFFEKGLSNAINFIPEALITAQPQLELLDFSFNNIGNDGAVAISRLTYLTHLDLRNNNIGNDGAISIAQHVTGLTYLDLRNNNLSDEGVRDINNLPHLTHLDLGHNNIGTDGIVAITEHLTGLTSLELGNNNIGSDGAISIAKNLTGLTNLNIGQNDIGDEGANAISSLSGLASLNLARNNIGNDGVVSIAKHLSGLTNLYLWYNNISVDGVISIAEYLTDLTHLELRGNMIDAEGAMAISVLTGLTRLNLMGNNIGTDGAVSIAKHLTNLSHLDLGNNDIGTDGAVSIANHLTDLIHLDLEGNKIGDDGAVSIAKHLTDLTNLDLGNNDIGDVGVVSVAEHLTGLTSLELKKNDVGTDGAVSIANHLTDLIHLDLEGNKIGDDGAKAVSSLTSLISLNLANNDIGNDGVALIAKHLTGLTSLHLWANKIRLDGAVSIAEHLTSLNVLHLWRNFVGTAGAVSIAENLTALKYLNLGYNDIGNDGAVSIAENLTGLASLNLAGNRIDVDGVVSIAKHLTGLTNLNIGNNEIGDGGAKVLSNLTGLTSINLESNQIGNDGVVSIANHLTDLVHLDLMNNDIGSDSVVYIAGHITRLTRLDLRYNNIDDVGASAISSLSDLSYLALAYNDIGDDGAVSIANHLTDLVYLDLRDNKIGDVGVRAVSRLTGLTHVDLCNNDFGPNSVQHLTDALLDSWRPSIQGGKLRYLAIMETNGGGAFGLPAELLDTAHALTLFRRWNAHVLALEANRVEPLLEAKILVVGKENVGKTSMCDLLIRNLSRDMKRVPTPGIDPWPLINTENYDFVEMGITDNRFRLRLWDFGGQDMLQGPHRLFFTRRSLYLLVLDDTNYDDTSYLKLLSVISHHGGNPPVIIVINKSDDEDRPGIIIKTEELKKEFSNIVAVCRLSCTGDADRIPDELSQERRKKLLQLIGNILEERELKPLPRQVKADAKLEPWLPHLRNGVDRSWLKVRDQLEVLARKKSILSDEEFREICLTAPNQGEAVTDKGSQDDMLELFNDLGIIVAMGLDGDGDEGPVTKDIRLLDPNWLTYGMYTIIWNTRQSDSNGEFNKSMVLDWLCNDSTPRLVMGKNIHHRYFPEQLDFILEMMCSRNVELAFMIEGTDSYVCPEALTSGEPDDLEPEPTDCLRLRYGYGYRHPGILPRFIVRTHHLAGPNPTRWKGGVILRIDDCRVRVGLRTRIKPGSNAELLEIIVTGPAAQLRSALGRVRDALEFIHRKVYPEVLAKAYVPFPEDVDEEIGYDELLDYERDREFDNSKPFKFPNASKKYSINQLLDGVRWESLPDTDGNRDYGWEVRANYPKTRNHHLPQYRERTNSASARHPSKTMPRSLPQPVGNSKASQNSTPIPNIELAKISDEVPKQAEMPWWKWVVITFLSVGFVSAVTLTVWNYPWSNNVIVPLWCALAAAFFMLIRRPGTFYKRWLAITLSAGLFSLFFRSNGEITLPAEFGKLRWDTGTDPYLLFFWLVVVVVLVSGDLIANGTK